MGISHVNLGWPLVFPSPVAEESLCGCGFYVSDVLPVTN